MSKKRVAYVRGKFLFEYGRGRLYEIRDPIQDKTIEEWFPTAQIDDEVMIDVEEEIVEFTCPQWLVEKKGFHWFPTEEVDG